MNLISIIFFMEVMIAVVLAIYGYFLFQIGDELFEYRKDSLRIRDLQNDMKCVVNKCSELSRTVEAMDKKRR